MSTTDMIDSSPTVVMVAHVLPADVRHHLRALCEAKLLRHASTGYFYRSEAAFERVVRLIDSTLGTRTATAFAKRPTVEGLDNSVVVRHAWHDFLRGLSQRVRVRESVSANLNDRAKARLSSCAAKRLKESDHAVFAREMEALELFERAKDLGVRCVYQLPIAHHATLQKVIGGELDRFIDRSATIRHEYSISEKRLKRKSAELSMADAILVPSNFVKNSLLAAGIEGRYINVIPFGAEPEWRREDCPRSDNIFLHAGQLSVRKGTHRLLQAWKRLRAFRTCELRLVGSMHLDLKFLSEFKGCYNYIGAMPRRMLRQQYAQASCFVLPSLAEGFAIVILEALSCGTPLVVSRNSGAEGFITNGCEGLLYDALDDEQLCESLEWMLTHPRERQEMSLRCFQKAQSWTWDHYRTAFVAFFSETINGGSVRQDSGARRVMNDADGALRR